MSEETNQSLSYNDFKTEWLKEIIENDPSTVELGHRFS